MFEEAVLSGAEGAGAREASTLADPVVPDWHNLQLPDAWPDQLSFLRLRDWLRFLRPIVGTPKRAEIPDDLPGKARLPKYLIQEFHGLPNGNFSKRITRGYITGFDRIMLGRMRRARKHILTTLADCQSILDVGCGGGQTAGLLKQSGANEVWGVDPSPYLLQHAARAFPEVHFVHGLAEQLDFADNRFDGLVACFVLHEMPPREAAQALREFHRVLKPGGKFALCEPSAEQLQLSRWELFKRYGWQGIYFRLLALRVHEPFVHSWHKQDVVALLEQAGFDVIADEQHMPVRHISAIKSKAIN